LVQRKFRALPSRFAFAAPHSARPPTPSAPAQEAYADLKKEKMSTGDGYLLVYSITDDTTFAKLDRVREEILKAQAGKTVPVFLIGTKADLAGDRAVSEKERLAKARAWNCKSFEVSAKTNAGVQQAFDELIAEVLTLSGDVNKGQGGGSVLGVASAAVVDAPITRKRRMCSIM
jgi:GTPase SAR1 family protein